MLIWFQHVLRMADERKTKQIYNANVELYRYQEKTKIGYDQIDLGKSV